MPRVGGWGGDGVEAFEPRHAAQRTAAVPQTAERRRLVPPTHLMDFDERRELALQCLGDGLEGDGSLLRENPEREFFAAERETRFRGMDGKLPFLGVLPEDVHDFLGDLGIRRQPLHVRRNRQTDEIGPRHRRGRRCERYVFDGSELLPVAQGDDTPLPVGHVGDVIGDGARAKPDLGDADM